jgi:hypothetical protein
MDQIPPHKLWIGSVGDLRDWRRLYDAGIRAVVHLAYEDLPPALPHDLVLCRFPLIDGDDNEPELMWAAVVCLTLLLEREFACLVCCHAGVSRSPAIAAAALSRLTHQSFEASLQEIYGHCHATIHVGLRAQVQALSESK